MKDNRHHRLSPSEKFGGERWRKYRIRHQWQERAVLAARGHYKKLLARILIRRLDDDTKERGGVG
jgi:hypothetical protein